MACLVEWGKVMPADAVSFAKPGAFDRIFGRTLGLLVRIGLIRGHFYVLEVRGRKSGRTVSLPVDTLELNGRRYLVCARGNSNWVTGWLDPRQPNNTDNTNTLLLLDPQWSSLGPYTKSAALYHCSASRITAQEGTSFYPVVRTISMSGWMGYNTTVWNPGYQLFQKTTDITALSPSDALVFIDERDDSIDDGYFAIDMVLDRIVNFPAGYHAGSGAATFADGHAEIHRWQSPEVLVRQQSGVEAVKHEYLPVSATNRDLVWLRAHATQPK